MRSTKAARDKSGNLPFPCCSANVGPVVADEVHEHIPHSAKKLLIEAELLVSVRRDIESNESFVIQRGFLILKGASDVDERKSYAI